MLEDLSIGMRVNVQTVDGVMMSNRIVLALSSIDGEPGIEITNYDPDSRPVFIKLENIFEVTVLPEEGV